VVMLPLALLAAIGLTWLSDGRRPWVRALILGTAAIVVIRLDLWPLPQGVNPTGPAPVFSRLVKLPSGTVAAYPVDNPEPYGDLFNQGYYDKPVVNGFGPDSPGARRAQQLADPSRLATARGLAALGVRYAVYTKDPTQPRLRFGRGFTPIWTDGTSAIYRIDPPGLKPAASAFAMGGFDAPELDARGQFMWLDQSTGKIQLATACAACKGRLSITVGSFERPRVVEFREAGEGLLFRRRIGGATRLAIPVRLGGRRTLTVTTTPGPTSVASAIPGSTDPRSVSISVRDLRVSSIVGK